MRGRSIACFWQTLCSLQQLWSGHEAPVFWGRAFSQRALVCSFCERKCSLRNSLCGWGRGSHGVCPDEIGKRSRKAALLKGCRREGRRYIKGGNARSQEWLCHQGQQLRGSGAPRKAGCARARVPAPPRASARGTTGRTARGQECPRHEKQRHTAPSPHHQGRQEWPA